MEQKFLHLLVFITLMGYYEKLSLIFALFYTDRIINLHQCNSDVWILNIFYYGAGIIEELFQLTLTNFYVNFSYL